MQNELLDVKQLYIDLVYLKQHSTAFLNHQYHIQGASSVI